MISILFLWWGRHLAVEYPRFRKLAYGVAIFLSLLMLAGIFADDVDLINDQLELFSGEFSEFVAAVAESDLGKFR